MGKIHGGQICLTEAGGYKHLSLKGSKRVMFKRMTNGVRTKVLKLQVEQFAGFGTSLDLVLENKSYTDYQRQSGT